MNQTPCLYSIVRFMPFVETGEFANVGVIMIAPEQRHFDFRLLIQRHARVTHFLERLEPKAYRAAMRNLREELERAWQDGNRQRRAVGQRQSPHMPWQ